MVPGAIKSKNDLDALITQLDEDKAGINVLLSMELEDFKNTGEYLATLKSSDLEFGVMLTKDKRVMELTVSGYKIRIEEL